MTNKKRILALSAAVVILMSCIMVAIIPASATVDWFTCLYSNEQNEGNVPHPYTSWREMLFEYYINSEETVYYFEVQNTELGGTRYAPHEVQWQLAYGAYQSGWGDVDLVYRFYVPYYNSSTGWDFQIRTDTGLVVVDTSTLTLNQHSLYAHIGYYEFTINRKVVGLSQGWYIYSNYFPPTPLSGGVRSYTIQFDYYFNDSIVGTKKSLVSASSNITEVPVPLLPNYIIIGAEGNGTYSNGNFVFSSIYSDQIVNVNVYSFDAYIQEEYQRGYDRGKTEGRAEGVIQGYQDYKNTQMYADALDDAYRKGYKAAVDDGAENQLISNPLLFVTEPVVAFLEIEPYPGLPLGVIFLASVAVCLLVVFLKIFSGG